MTVRGCGWCYHLSITPWLACVEGRFVGTAPVPNSHSVKQLRITHSARLEYILSSRRVRGSCRKHGQVVHQYAEWVHGRQSTRQVSYLLQQLCAKPHAQYGGWDLHDSERV